MTCQKAFDCVSHEKLIKKMESYGVGGTAFRMMGFYLANRVQIVSVNGARSQHKHVGQAMA